MLSCIVLLCCVVTKVIGFTSGPPELACNTHNPSHASSVTPGNGNYSIKFEAQYWEAGVSLGVDVGSLIDCQTFPSDPSCQFQGLLMAVYSPPGTIALANRVGTFGPNYPVGFRAVCSNRGVSHSNANQKPEKDFDFLPDVGDAGKGQLTVHATVLRSFSEWYKISATIDELCPTANCSSNPCMNGGTCNAICPTVGATYECSCASGFTGAQCQTELLACDSMPCQNNGVCLDLPGNAYNCTCPTGTTGVNCQTNIDECASTPCQNSGTCVDGIGSFECTCTIGFVGSRCETNFDDCNSDPCQHNADCIDGIGSYFCANCEFPYWGTNCQFERTDFSTCGVQCNGQHYCRTDTCGEQSCVCSGNGHPVIMGDEDETVCLCERGFTGTQCELGIDDTSLCNISQAISFVHEPFVASNCTTPSTSTCQNGAYRPINLTDFDIYSPETRKSECFPPSMDAFVLTTNDQATLLTVHDTVCQQSGDHLTIIGVSFDDATSLRKGILLSATPTNVRGEFIIHSTLSPHRQLYIQRPYNNGGLAVISRKLPTRPTLWTMDVLSFPFFGSTFCLVEEPSLCLDWDGSHAVLSDSSSYTWRFEVSVSVLSASVGGHHPELHGVTRISTIHGALQFSMQCYSHCLKERECRGYVFIPSNATCKLYDSSITAFNPNLFDPDFDIEEGYQLAHIEFVYCPVYGQAVYFCGKRTLGPAHIAMYPVDSGIPPHLATIRAPNTPGGLIRNGETENFYNDFAYDGLSEEGAFIIEFFDSGCDAQVIFVGNTTLQWSSDTQQHLVSGMRHDSHSISSTFIVNTSSLTQSNGYRGPLYLFNSNGRPVCLNITESIFEAPLIFSTSFNQTLCSIFLHNPQDENNAQADLEFVVYDSSSQLSSETYPTNNELFCRSICLQWDECGGVQYDVISETSITCTFWGAPDITTASQPDRFIWKRSRLPAPSTPFVFQGGIVITSQDGCDLTLSTSGTLPLNRALAAFECMDNCSSIIGCNFAFYNALTHQCTAYFAATVLYYNGENPNLWILEKERFIEPPPNDPFIYLADGVSDFVEQIHFVNGIDTGHFLLNRTSSSTILTVTNVTTRAVAMVAHPSVLLQFALGKGDGSGSQITFAMVSTCLVVGDTSYYSPAFQRYVCGDGEGGLQLATSPIVLDGTSQFDEVNCIWLACFNGLQSCDDDAVDGCETNVTETIAHCGTCGYDCAALANVNVTSCVAGVCVINLCDPGFQDDNEVSTDGCELNTPECVSTPCKNGATCVDGINSFVCQCVHAYFGTLCETLCHVTTLDFAGKHNYITRLIFDNGDTTSLEVSTILVWFRVTEYTTEERRWFSLSFEDPLNPIITLQFYNTYLSLVQHALIPVEITTTTFSLQNATSDWHLYSIVYDTNTVTVCVDGTYCESTSDASDIFANEVTMMMIGNISGSIDHVSIENVARTEEEIQDIYNGDSPLAVSLTYIPFNDTTGVCIRNYGTNPEPNDCATGTVFVGVVTWPTCDSCYELPCSSNSTCLNELDFMGRSPYCDCLFGWTGVYCNISIPTG